MVSKGELGKKLSMLGGFKNADVKLEQYITDSEIAAEVLWFLNMNNEIKGKVIADLGCGNGVLGIGCLLLKSKKVYFVDKDEKVLEIAKKNYSDLSLELEKGVFVNKDVGDFKRKVDLVIENPPFGVQRKRADRVFLDAGMKIADKIYSFHKVESFEFLRKYCEGFKVSKIKEFEFVLRRTLKFHKREKHYVRVGFFGIEKTE